MWQREKDLTKLLNNAPEEHLDLVAKLQKGLKVAQKSKSCLLREAAAWEAGRVREAGQRPRYWVTHRRDGDSDFIAAFLKELDDSVRPH